MNVHSAALECSTKAVHLDINTSFQFFLSFFFSPFPLRPEKIGVFTRGAPVALHVLGVDYVQVLCIDQFGKQTGPERGNKNNRQMC